jgi:CheY-like chemotaxis protein
MFRPIIGSNTDLHFEVELVGEPFHMFTDQAKLAQILRNLVSNAIKFTEKGRVTVTAQLIAADMVEFKVTDTGLGIQPENLEMIFEDFSQIDSPLQRKQKGTGLGLPLSKKLATLLEGHISVRSQIAEGSEFSLVIPQNYGGENEGVLFDLPNGKKKPSAIKHGAGDLSAFKVLLIDDDEPSRYIMRTLISEELHAQFMEAENGSDGLDLVKSFQPDVVFLDLSMPGIAGLEFLTMMKSEGATQDIPVIVNTATDLTPPELVYLKSMVTAVLSKDRTNDEEALHALREALAAAGFDYHRK